MPQNDAYQRKGETNKAECTIVGFEANADSERFFLKCLIPKSVEKTFLNLFQPFEGFFIQLHKQEKQTGVPYNHWTARRSSLSRFQLWPVVGSSSARSTYQISDNLFQSFLLFAILHYDSRCLKKGLDCVSPKNPQHLFSFQKTFGLPEDPFGRVF